MKTFNIQSVALGLPRHITFYGEKAPWVIMQFCNQTLAHCKFAQMQFARIRSIQSRIDVEEGLSVVHNV